MAFAGFRQKDTTCGCCGGTCVYVSDHFERELVGSDYVQNAGTWSIVDGELTAGENAQITHQMARPNGLPNIHARVRVKLPASGATARLNIGLLSIEIEAASSGCGKMRLLNGGQLGPEVLVPGLVPSAFHRMHLCYSRDTGILMGHVAVLGLGGDKHHARAVSLADNVLCGLTTGSSTGDYYFDDFILDAVQSDDSAYYGEVCPCCWGGCESFNGQLGDCRWTSESGSWAGGVTSSSGAIKLLNKGWSGLDRLCEPDETQSIRATFDGLEYGDEVVLYADWAESGSHHSAKLTLNADAFTQGTLKLFKDGSQIATTNVTALPGSHTLHLCYDQVTLVATLNDANRLTKDSAGHDGMFVAVGTGTISGTVTVSGVAVNHMIYDFECLDCFNTEPTNCTACEDELAPQHLKLRLQNMVSSIPLNNTRYCNQLNEKLFIMHLRHSSTGTLSGWNLLCAYEPWGITSAPYTVPGGEREVRRCMWSVYPFDFSPPIVLFTEGTYSVVIDALEIQLVTFEHDGERHWWWFGAIFIIHTNDGIQTFEEGRWQLLWKSKDTDDDEWPECLTSEMDGIEIPNCQYGTFGGGGPPQPGGGCGAGPPGPMLVGRL